MKIYHSDHRLKAEGLPGVFFASPNWDHNNYCENPLPEMFNRGPIPISAVSTTWNATSLMHNLSHSHLQSFMIRSNTSIAKCKSSSVDHGKCYCHTCSDSSGPAASTCHERQSEQNRQQQAWNCERVWEIHTLSCAPVKQEDYEMGNGGGPSVLEQPEGYSSEK